MQAQQCVQLSDTNWPCGLITLIFRAHGRVARPSRSEADKVIYTPAVVASTSISFSGNPTVLLKTRFPGDHRAAVPPVPIPNTAVKRRLADGSACIACARVGRCRVYRSPGPKRIRASFFPPLGTEIPTCAAGVFTPNDPKVASPSSFSLFSLVFPRRLWYAPPRQSWQTEVKPNNQPNGGVR